MFCMKPLPRKQSAKESPIPIQTGVPMVVSKFEIRADGSFVISPSFTWEAEDSRVRSETSSMKAEASSEPDLSGTSMPEEGSLEPLTSQEHSDDVLPTDTLLQLLKDTGCWLPPQSADACQEGLVPTWRLDPVNLADVEADASTSIAHAPGSILESVPSLTKSGHTEESPRDTDSVFLGHSIRHDGGIVRAHLAAHESRLSDTPQLKRYNPDAIDDFLLGFGYWRHQWFSASFNEDPGRPNGLHLSRAIPELQTDSTALPVAEGDNKDPDPLDEGESLSQEYSSSDEESLWVSDFSEEVPVLDEAHPFLLAKSEVVREAILAYQAWKQRPHDGSSGSSGSSSSHTNKTSHYGSTKRKSPAKRDNDDADGEDDGRDPRKRRTRNPKQSEFEGRTPSLACPFAKKDPLKLRSTVRDRLSPKMTLENQWFTIFDILFPEHEPRPRSAYVNTDLTVELEMFQDMMLAEGPGTHTGEWSHQTGLSLETSVERSGSRQFSEHPMSQTVAEEEEIEPEAQVQAIAETQGLSDATILSWPPSGPFSADISQDTATLNHGTNSANGVQTRHVPDFGIDDILNATPVNAQFFFDPCSTSQPDRTVDNAGCRECSESRNKSTEV
ncbi:hypothetical protein DL765_002907 [Monosporascus sp. GIB2]|nr:hypothetical protein DL765_002907 [Monosporascus sp. GIB2]